MKRTGSSAALACALTSLLVAHSVSAEPLSRNTSGFAVLASEPTDRIYLSVAVPEAGAAGQSRRFVAHGSQVGKLRQLIGWVDAGAKDYDAVQYGARVRPGKRPTQMTIGEIFRWIEQTPGQPHAIGRYQFIPATLRSLVRETGLDPRTRFSPDVQDLLADILLEDAGCRPFWRGGSAATASWKTWRGSGPPFPPPAAGPITMVLPATAR